MSSFARRYNGWLLALAIPVICLLSAGAASLAVPIPDEDDFNVVQWELRHVPGKWLYLTGQLLGGGLSREGEDQRLQRFLLLSDQIRGVEVAFAAGDADELQTLLAERDKLENDVEAIIEGRLTAVLEEAGLESSLPLFPDARWVFPPVDVEFDEPPRSLSISPRSHKVGSRGRPTSRARATWPRWWVRWQARRPIRASWRQLVTIGGSCPQSRTSGCTITCFSNRLALVTTTASSYGR